MKPSPIHPGGSPRDILRQQKIAQQAPKREAVVSKIKLLLQKNKINDVFVQHLNTVGEITVRLKQDATDEEMNKVIGLLKSNGAVEKKGKLSMDGIRFYVSRNYETSTIY